MRIDFDSVRARVCGGALLEKDELLALAQAADQDALFRLSDSVRAHFLGKRVDTCAIMNARSGRCSENCKWCAQSAHWKTGAGVYGAVSADEAFAQAQAAHARGIARFSLVTSGRALSDADVEKMCEAFRKMGGIKGLYLCGSFGLLTRAQFARLKAAGMRRFHCNLETAPSKFPELCTTHTTQDKLAAIAAARAEGMEICSGGIIGMGETLEQRVELALAVRAAGAVSIPVNVLQPIKGTPLESLPPISPQEILTAFAVFRLANPRAHIRFAAGRAAFREFQRTALRAGASAILMGDMLTTVGSSIADDFKMLGEMGYDAAP